MHENPYDGPASDEVSTKPPRNVAGWLFRGFLAVAFLVVLIALLLPSVRTTGESARRNSCKNKMKQLAVALQNYVDDRGELPPAYTVDENGNPLHSWRTLILPYIEQAELYKSIDLSKPWNDPVNAVAFNTVVDDFQCPSSLADGNRTTYLAVVTPESCLHGGKRRSAADITDGAGQTLMLIEVDEAQAVPWMQPVDADEQTVLALSEDSQLSHASGVHAVFADGRVHYLSPEVPADQRRAMISIAAGDGDKLDPDALFP